MTTESKIAKQIREEIDANVHGRGPAVIAQDKNTMKHRIVNVRVRKGVVEGKALNSGKWFTLSGWGASQPVERKRCEWCGNFVDEHEAEILFQHNIMLGVPAAIAGGR
jgi:hypothetical protein